MSACCNYVTNELLEWKRETLALRKSLASMTSDRDWYKQMFAGRGAENERMARRIRSFEGAATKRKNQRREIRLAEKGKP